MATKFITVTIETMHDKNLSPNQKFILSEISQLSSLEKGCIASNRHFSELIGISNAGVSNAITDLVKKGYIDIDNSNTKRNYGRVITIHSDVAPLHSDVLAIHSDVETKENITSNKTTNTYLSFLEQVKEKVSIKSKVTKTKEGKELFDKIENKDLLLKSYVNHQLEKKEFSQRLTAYMMDYNPAKNERTIGGYTIG
mgnify:CR=1 FL=1